MTDHDRPPDPTPAPPSSAPRFPFTRAALERYDVTRGHRTRHAEATAAYMIREGFYRDTRTLGNDRRTIAQMPLNHIRAAVAKDDVTRGQVRSVLFDPIAIEAVSVHPVECRPAATVSGGERRDALRYLQVTGKQPTHARVCYDGIPVLRDEVIWGDLDAV